MTDGTVAGTMLLRDITVGSANTTFVPFSSAFAILDGKAYFSASNGINGRELCVTDGTPAGTTMFRDYAFGAFEMDTRSAVFDFYGVAGAGWVVAGTGDYSGDGTADVLWNQSSTNAFGAFEMDTAPRSSPSTASVGPAGRSCKDYGLSLLN